jgi:hypothetical protein
METGSFVHGRNVIFIYNFDGLHSSERKKFALYIRCDLRKQHWQQKPPRTTGWISCCQHGALNAKFNGCVWSNRYFGHDGDGASPMSGRDFHRIEELD